MLLRKAYENYAVLNKKNVIVDNYNMHFHLVIM